MASLNTSTPFALPRDALGVVTTLLSTLHGAHRVGKGIFQYLTTLDALAFRLANEECRQAIAAFCWHDTETNIKSSLAAWRRCFPLAVAANVSGRRYLRDEDFVFLRGIQVLDMRCCYSITDTGLENLMGIKKLDMSYCKKITDAGLKHLKGIKKLDMRYCDKITNAGLEHLRGIKELDMSYCDRITDSGLEHLFGIHTLILQNTRISGTGFAYIRGIKKLDMTDCFFEEEYLVHLTGIHTLCIADYNGIIGMDRLTDAGLAFLKGIHYLNMSGCYGATTAGLEHLRGIHELHMFNCEEETINAALALDLPVFT